jgi:hypothetical protein
MDTASVAATRGRYFAPLGQPRRRPAQRAPIRKSNRLLANDLRDRDRYDWWLWVPSAGFAVSSIEWGATEKNSYSINTGVFSDSTGFIPPGFMQTCTSISNGLTGKLTNLVAPTTLTAINKTLNVAIKFTSTTPAGCYVSAALSGITGTATAFGVTGSGSTFVASNTQYYQYGTGPNLHAAGLVDAAECNWNSDSHLDGLSDQWHNLVLDYLQKLRAGRRYKLGRRASNGPPFAKTSRRLNVLSLVAPTT